MISTSCRQSLAEGRAWPKAAFPSQNPQPDTPAGATVLPSRPSVKSPVWVTRRPRIYGCDVEYFPDFAFFAYEPTDDERSQVNAWIIVNDCRGVEGISISKTAITIDGIRAPLDIRTGAAVRRGDLTGELTEALKMLRQALRRDKP